MRMSFRGHSHRNPRIHGIGNHGLAGALHAGAADWLWNMVDDRTDGGCILHQAAAHVHAARTAAVHELASQDESECVGLDLGTGTGRFAHALVDTGVCSRAVAIDASRPMLRVASANRHGRPVVYPRADVCTMRSLPTADVIALSFVLHEMPAANARVLFGKIADSLKPTGLMVVVDADPIGPSVLPRWYVNAWEPYMDEYVSTFGAFVREREYLRYGLQLVTAERTVPGAACIWIFEVANSSHTATAGCFKGSLA